MSRLPGLDLGPGLVTSFTLVGLTLLALVSGDCLVVQVRRAVHQPSINGLYKRHPLTCDGRDVWQRMALAPSPRPGRQGDADPRYLQFGHTTDGDYGWLVVTDFCTLDTTELAAVAGDLGYPYDVLTLGRWREFYEGEAPSYHDNATTNGWMTSHMIVTCAKTEDDAYYDYDVEVVPDESLSGAAIFGIIVGILLLVCLLVCALRLAHRRTVVTTRHVTVYRSPPPTSTLLQTSAIRFESRPAVYTSSYNPAAAVYYPGVNRVVIQSPAPSGGYQPLPVAPPPSAYTQASPTMSCAPPAY